MPKRIQQKRTKGWRKPEGAIVVSRPSFWGNPFRIQDMRPDIDPRKTACTRYAAWLSGVDFPQASAEHRKDIRARLPELLGTDLCCWCKPGELCHAGLLLELANHNLVAGGPPLISYTMTTRRGRGTTSFQQYPLLRESSGCPTARYVGGTSIYLCECESPGNCPGAIRAAWSVYVYDAVERLGWR